MVPAWWRPAEKTKGKMREGRGEVERREDMVVRDRYETEEGESQRGTDDACFAEKEGEKDEKRRTW